MHLKRIHWARRILFPRDRFNKVSTKWPVRRISPEGKILLAIKTERRRGGGEGGIESSRLAHASFLIVMPRPLHASTNGRSRKRGTVHPKRRGELQNGFGVAGVAPNFENDGAFVGDRAWVPHTLGIKTNKQTRPLKDKSVLI